jgi:hypothetical protein
LVTERWHGTKKTKKTKTVKNLKKAKKGGDLGEAVGILAL